MNYYVYIIKSTNYDSRTYVGWTNNLNKRLKAHNRGKGAKYTRGREWRIIYFEKLSSKKKAMQREYVIKKDRKLRLKLKKKFK